MDSLAPLRGLRTRANRLPTLDERSILTQLRLGDLAALDLDDLDREDEAIAAANLRRAATVAVGEVGGDVELPLVALDHDLHRLSPALDDLVRGEGRRRAAVVRRVELGAGRVLRGSAPLV